MKDKNKLLNIAGIIILISLFFHVISDILYIFVYKFGPSGTSSYLREGFDLILLLFSYICLAIGFFKKEKSLVIVFYATNILQCLISFIQYIPIVIRDASCIYFLIGNISGTILNIAFIIFVYVVFDKMSFNNNKNINNQTVMNKRNALINVENQKSTACAITEYKQLLDIGAITQEEFDAKKNELLGNSINDTF